MSGFDSNKLFTIIKTKVNAKYSNCTVGRYITPKETQFPYLDVSIQDRSGSAYSLSGSEGAQIPLVVLTMYNNGSNADVVCEKILLCAKDVMLEYFYQCKFGPAKVENADTSIARWVSRYQRVVGSGDSF